MSDDDLLLEVPARETNLADALDRVLHRGAVVRAEVMITVAEIDLVYLDLRLFLSSVDRALEAGAWTSLSPPAVATASQEGS